MDIELPEELKKKIKAISWSEFAEKYFGTDMKIYPWQKAVIDKLEKDTNEQ